METNFFVFYYIIFYLQGKRSEKLTRSICELARSTGCGGMGISVFDDYDRGKK